MRDFEYDLSAIILALTTMTMWLAGIHRITVSSKSKSQTVPKSTSSISVTTFGKAKENFTPGKMLISMGLIGS